MPGRPKYAISWWLNVVKNYITKCSIHKYKISDTNTNTGIQIQIQKYSFWWSAWKTQICLIFDSWWFNVVKNYITKCSFHKYMNWDTNTIKRYSIFGSSWHFVRSCICVFEFVFVLLFMEQEKNIIVWASHCEVSLKRALKNHHRWR